jgi:hypothetical protein
MIETGVACAGALDQTQAEFHVGWGRAAQKKDIFFDLASLTKVIVTGSLLVDYCLSHSIDLLDFRFKSSALGVKDFSFVGSSFRFKAAF